MTTNPVPAPVKAPAKPPAKRPILGLALGGGGARGLAHLIVLETLDELGLRPDVISGTSIGAIYGAGYAAGFSGKMLRAHTEELLSARVDLIRQVISARADPIGKFLNFLPIRAALLNAETLLDSILPSKMPVSFEALSIPLRIVATDFYAQEAIVLSSGPLQRAVAASMALPALFSPVMLDGRAAVDGGLVNPLPFDVIAGEADITIAIDVSGAARGDAKGAHPSAIEVLMASSQILQRSIVREKLRAQQPDIYIDCAVDAFTVLDFHRFREVLASAAPAKEQLKRQLDRVLGSQRTELAAPERAQLSAKISPPKQRLEK
jgi:NTE family protein